jgi:phosphate transporter
MGGIALGRGVTSSGLLDDLGVGIRKIVEGLSLYNIVLVLSAMVLVRNTSSVHVGCILTAFR